MASGAYTLRSGSHPERGLGGDHDHAEGEEAAISVAIVTGSGGLIGSESVRFFAEDGFDVIGVENDMRSYFFGPAAPTARVSAALERELDNFRSEQLDIRDEDGVRAVFERHRRDIDLVVHTVAQPSHDWAASDPHTDFSINATGTMNLLQAARDFTPDATFIFMSTNKVYGDRPNLLPLVENDTRLERARNHEYFSGIPTSMSIDHCTHSLFGVSKAAADCLLGFSCEAAGCCRVQPGRGPREQHLDVGGDRRVRANRRPAAGLGYER